MKIILIITLLYSASVVADNIHTDIRISQCYSIKDNDDRQLCIAQTNNQRYRCYNIKDNDKRQLCIATTSR